MIQSQCLSMHRIEQHPRRTHAPGKGVLIIRAQPQHITTQVFDPTHVRALTTQTRENLPLAVAEVRRESLASYQKTAGEYSRDRANGIAGAVAAGDGGLAGGVLVQAMARARVATPRALVIKV